MHPKRILAILLVCIGVACLYGSYYIHTQVVEGRGKISSAQGKVDTSKKLFSLNPATEKVGKHLTDPVQSRIDAGSQEANQYSQYATWLMVGGIILIAGGITLYVMRHRNSKRSK